MMLIPLLKPESATAQNHQNCDRASFALFCRLSFVDSAILHMRVC